MATSHPVPARPLMALASLCAATLVLTGAGPVALAMLDRLEPGQWEVRNRDMSGGRTLICLSNGRGLIQIRHERDSCTRFVVEDRPDMVTVHYTCPGNGYGQTSVRFENARLAQVETQGIAAGLPFAFAAEARRLGGCPH